MSSFILVFLLILIPVFISTMFIPYWTRRTESFGISIPEEIYNTKELKALRNRYAVFTGILSLMTSFIFLISSLVLSHEFVMSILFTVSIVLYIIISFLIYLKFHREMKRMKEKENWSKEKSQQVFIDIRFRNHRLTHSNLWFIISFLIAIITFVITIQSYQQIPERIPMQYNFAGEVTNWADKSHRTVLINPILQMYIIMLFLFINTMIGKAKQQIDPENPEESMRGNILFRRRWSAYIIISGLALSLMFSLIQLSIIYPIHQQFLTAVPLVITFGLIMGAVILSITTGQGGSRIKSTSSKSGKIINRDDDKYWKLGQFYYNKQDPALFLEKRFGVGWTINLARPLAWIILLGIIGLALLIPFLLGA
ncbi:DUF1648 domain-containing protein [Oceanobacillus saliphilus]|uniref:DUF1648 domain-containing protein n=1 Tax=Oceanobacillus saliphilus TaxID=2925834 RepID=UPI00201DE8E8|nr:DUF5808 domain-containing protein [Oceanobacillus saliphilus]